MCLCCSCCWHCVLLFVPLFLWPISQSLLRSAPWCWGRSPRGDTGRWSVAWCGCSSGSRQFGFGCGRGRGSPGSGSPRPWSLYRTDPWRETVRQLPAISMSSVSIWSKSPEVSSPVQDLVQRLIGRLVTLDPLHEVLNGLLCVAVEVVWTVQLHLLQKVETEGEDFSREQRRTAASRCFLTSTQFVLFGPLHHYMKKPSCDHILR